MSNSERKTDPAIMPSNFIHNIIDEDLKNGVYGGRVYTRFPPEPNGYLHIGHAKSICLNFGTALKYGGKCNLRFDDTNPVKEDVEYVESIREDVRWLGFEWTKLLYASDYFDTMYELAEKLILKDKAYVCELTPEQMREYRGSFDKPGKDSPYRERPKEESLDLFRRMKAGEFKEGQMTLRAKIDMASPNMNMRDPAIYRIVHASHHNTGDKWCIYPMYDYAHPIEDAIEGITHSICTLEFEDHRPFYDWVLRETEWEQPPQQIEFARLDITNMVMSKRYLKRLVDENKVSGWDDPRMSTISGLRRRGYTPASIRDFAERIGVSKANSEVDITLLEHCIRDDLKMHAQRKMAVLNPLKLVITNYPEDQLEWMEAENNAENEEMGTRKIPFTRELYIERDDFMEEPPAKYYRLYPGNEVRLRNAYFVTCEKAIKDEAGNIVEVHCTYDPQTRSGSGFNARKVKGTIHWVSAKEYVPATVRLYDYLFVKNEETGEYEYNADSIKVLEGCVLEKSFEEAKKDDKFQFNRHGYFVVDTKDTTEDHLVFNRIVGLKDSFNAAKKK
ncbi:MAG: glutamine--tRNA ligase/YqeY domain fusion protein [Peptostreptococcaceae bacterium]|nr:glutamine--tRNA ligase/YqeY domain fusion protein [Peptostreptococcaceae bacterium]